MNANGRPGRFGTWGGHWVVRDGDTIVATGYQQLRLKELFDIEIRGRQLQIQHHRKVGCVIVEEPTGRQVLDLAYEVLLPAEESAVVTLPSGRRLHWTLRFRNHDRMTGFYDESGAPVLTIALELPWDPRTPRSAWGHLWRFWLAFMRASDHYRADIDADLAARLMPPDDLAMLVMLAVWLDTSKQRREPTRLANSSHH